MNDLIGVLLAAGMLVVVVCAVVLVVGVPFTIVWLLADRYLVRRARLERAAAQNISSETNPRAVRHFLSPRFDPTVILAAVRRIGELRDVGAEMKLLELLNRSTGVAVKHSTLDVLQRLPWSFECRCAALKNEDEHVRRVAIAALVALGDPRAIGPLERSLGDAHPDREIPELLDALDVLGWSWQERSAALERSHNGIGWRYGRIASCMARKGDRRIGPILVGHLNSVSDDMVAEAATALGLLGDPAASDPLKQKEADLRHRLSCMEPYDPGEYVQYDLVEYGCVRSPSGDPRYPDVERTLQAVSSAIAAIEALRANHATTGS